MKVHVVTLGHAPANILTPSIDRFYETRNRDLAITHHILDGHYPLRCYESQRAIVDACNRYGIVLHDAGRNLGLHHGFNYVYEIIKPAAEDVVILYDPDSYPLSSGWDMALVTAVTLGKFAVAGLVNDAIDLELKERYLSTELVDGYLRVVRTVREGMISVSAWSGEFLRHTHGFHEPNALYGGLEADMWGRLDGRKWGYLCDYREDSRLNRLQDPEYKEWKHCHAHAKNWPGSFSEFIAAGCPKS